MRFSLFLVAALFGAFPLSNSFAEEFTLDAFAPLVVVGEHSVVSDDGIAKIAGTIQGPLYVSSGSQPVEEGSVSCKFTLTVNTATQDEAGVGTCKISYSDGTELRADTSCKGIVGQGCDGDFRITDGSGRYEGATGLGQVSFKTRKRGYRLDADGDLTEMIFGVAYWEDYKFKLPD